MNIVSNYTATKSVKILRRLSRKRYKPLSKDNERSLEAPNKRANNKRRGGLEGGCCSGSFVREGGEQGLSINN